MVDSSKLTRTAAQFALCKLGLSVKISHAFIDCLQTMAETPFIDFYELLELNPKASADAIEQMYRIIGKRFHPEVGTNKDAEKFKLVTTAYQTLRDPARRTAYDSLHTQNQRDKSDLNQGAKATAADYAIRHRMLELFYAARRRNMKQPGMGIAKLEELLGIPTEIIEFHVWYFKEKGWVQRETAGPLSITAAGVDEIEGRQRALQASGGGHTDLSCSLSV